MSTTKIPLAIVCIVVMVTVANSLDCSHLYRKESEGILNYLANVTITVPYTTTTGWDFFFVFNRNFTGIGVWDGIISTNPEQGTARMWNKTDNGNLQLGSQFSFRFRINWSEVTPAKNPPVLEGLKFGDVEMC